jgi:hypothetical protein
MQKTDVNNTALAIFFVAAAVVMIAGLAVSVIQQTAFADQGGQAKVTSCHNPPGNSDNKHEVTEGEPAFEQHVRQHGDYIGPCV